ncbi:MAG TPA: guanylate kinase [Cellvibrionales bacterium]|nr:guanylate kinase [Pseudomonadales bacterium]HAB54906.1 guanylate kinase [Cellvibrionales bacterium]HAW13617.1 guanylate kinase [Cellvibrionales bacterium]HCX26349.1 guanylate kinase [Cellvibrionales bacterium]
MSPVRGNLFTVSAPSGAGKTSLVNALVATDERLRVSVSNTTRAIRPGETDGVNYHFTEAATFEQMIKEGSFLEYATVFGNSYGTSKIWVNEQLDLGFDVILEIDWQGALQAHQWLMAEQGSAGVGIFILPPSLHALRSRLEGRGQDGSDIIDGRMAAAVDEMSHFEQADYLIINDDFDIALADLKAVILATRLRLSQQQSQYQPLLASLLAD